MSGPVLRPADIDLIAGFEGFRSFIYDDKFPNRPYEGGAVVGTLTIGYGDTAPSILERFQNGISEPEARVLLADRADQFAREVLSWLTRTPTPNQLGALTSLAYNIGTSEAGFGGSTVRNRFNAGDLAGAAEAFLMWHRGNEAGELLSRRKLEVEYFLSTDNNESPNRSNRPKETPEMMIISFAGRAFLLSGGVVAPIDNPGQIDQLKAAGVPEVQGDHAWAAAFRQNAGVNA